MEKDFYKVLASVEVSRALKAQMKRAQANRDLSEALADQKRATQKYELELSQFQSVQDLIVQAHKTGLDLIMHEAQMKRDHSHLKSISRAYSDAVENADKAREEITHQAHLEVKSTEKKSDLDRLSKLDAFQKDAQIEEEVQESLVLVPSKRRG